jgi:hypothetical protein
MSLGWENLETRLSQVIAWERRKRREETVIAALCYALIGAVCVQPFMFPLGRYRWVVPLLLFTVFALWLLWRQRWRERDTTRALAALDRALNLHERAITAWDLIRRQRTQGMGLLVVRQAEERLGRQVPRELFPRAWHWQAYMLAPLLGLWLALFWWASAHRPENSAMPAAPLAQKLSDFARQLQEKAQSEGLPQTLKAGRELEKVAQRSSAEKATEEELKGELAGMAKRLAGERAGAQSAAPASSRTRQELEDLRAELQGARDLFDFSDPGAASWQDRLAGMTQLKKELDKTDSGAAGASREELKALLDKLEEQVAGELDRRMLLEAEQYLQQLAQGGQKQPGEAQARAGGSEERHVPGEGRRENDAGSAPGEEPGAGADQDGSLPDFRGGARAQVKGAIGEGERSVLYFKAKPAPGKSSLGQDEVIASYRRQAEAELNKEQIPDELKDVIKSYFLSLENESAPGPERQR